MARIAHNPRELLLTLTAFLTERPLDLEEVMAALHKDGPSPALVRAAVEALKAERLIEAEADGGRIAYRTTAVGQKALLLHRSWAHSFLFTDAVGSTALLDRLGDDPAYELRRRHFARLRAAIRAHLGSEVKSLGDGLMVAFASAESAAGCAVAMQRSAARGNDPMSLRIGIDAGPAVRDGEDFFGRPVIVAKRLCDAARGGQILVSETVRELVDGCETDRFEPVGGLELKGLSDPVPASSLHWKAAPSSTQDPPLDLLRPARRGVRHLDPLPAAGA